MNDPSSANTIPAHTTWVARARFGGIIQVHVLDEPKDAFQVVRRRYLFDDGTEGPWGAGRYRPASVALWYHHRMHLTPESTARVPAIAPMTPSELRRVVTAARSHVNFVVLA